MRTPRTLVLAVVALAATLAACSAPGTGPTMTAEETGDRVGSLGMRASTVFSDPALAELWQAVEGLSPAGLPHEGSALPRGVFELDETSGTWVQVAESDDLELNWAAEPGGEAARLVVDWDAGAPTVTRTLTTGEEAELPTGAHVGMTLGGAVVADLDQTATWPVNQCGTLTEPGDLRVSGDVTHGDAALAIDRVGFSLDAGETTATADGSGGLELTVPAGRAWVDWDADLAMNVTRDDATCEVTDAEVTSGRLRVDAGVEGQGGGGSVGVATDFEPVDDPSSPHGVAIALANGRLTLDGATAVTWNGVLDDENGNGVPGENLVLTFEDGTMTLEEFLTDQFGPLAIGARVIAALR